MATNFPISLDDFANYVDGTTIMESAVLNDMQFAIEALQAKAGIDSSAVTSSHDYKIAQLEAASFLNISSATVFNTSLTSSNTWQDLDLSSEVGVNAALVFFEIKAGGSIDFWYKPKGQGAGSAANHRMDGGGIGNIDFPAGGNKYTYGICMTDGSGVIQIAGDDNSNTLTIKILSYIK